jgi:hypothetical protein
MSHCIYLTHLQDLNRSAKEVLAEAGLTYRHTPFVKETPCTLTNPVFTDFAIITSFTAIKYAAPWLFLFEKIYCIGSQTADYAREYGLESEKIVQGVSSQPSLEELFDQEHAVFSEKKGTWYGSSAGAYKHRFLFEEYSNIDAQISHWNWPNYAAAQNLASFLKEGVVICSSISAAMAAGSSLWNENTQLIVSSSRLKKYFHVTSINKIHISAQWLPEIIGKLL